MFDCLSVILVVFILNIRLNTRNGTATHRAFVAFNSRFIFSKRYGWLRMHRAPHKTHAQMGTQQPPHKHTWFCAISKLEKKIKYKNEVNAFIICYYFYNIDAPLPWWLTRGLISRDSCRIKEFFFLIIGLNLGQRRLTKGTDTIVSFILFRKRVDTLFLLLTDYFVFDGTRQINRTFVYILWNIGNFLCNIMNRYTLQPYK